jgi:hypothetical protein
MGVHPSLFAIHELNSMVFGLVEAFESRRVLTLLPIKAKL